MEKKVFDFELKELNEDGTFTGHAAVFRVGKNTDLGKDRIEKGAFRKTLRENEAFPLHWYHNIMDPVGEVGGKEDDIGLAVKGTMILDVQRARELYALMKKTKSVAKQLSIGYDAVKWEMDGDIRAIKEIKLYEISIVTWGMDQDAFITDVKCADCPRRQMIFAEAKPYANEHSARLKEPDDFDKDTFRRKNDGTIYGKIKVPATAAVIWAKLKGHSEPEDEPHPQAIRFPTKDWTVEEAKAWLKENNVKYIAFEPAEKYLESVLSEVASWVDPLTDEQSALAVKAAEALSALLKPVEPLPGTPQAGEPPVSDDKSLTHLLSSSNAELEKFNASFRR